MYESLVRLIIPPVHIVLKVHYVRNSNCQFIFQASRGQQITGVTTNCC